MVVVDEGGQFAMPLLSGHLGGANDLARTLIGALLEAEPVVTTATDVRGLCSPWTSGPGSSTGPCHRRPAAWIKEVVRRGFWPGKTGGLYLRILRLAHPPGLSTPAGGAGQSVAGAGLGRGLTLTRPEEPGL